MLAKELMEPNVISIRKETPAQEIANLMLEHHISGFPVVDRLGNVLGVVSELDLMYKEIKGDEPGIWETLLWGILDTQKVQGRMAAAKKYMGRTAGEIMTSPALTVDEMDNVNKVGRLMFEERIKRVFVTRGGSLVGVISRSAFIRLLFSDEKPKQGKKTVGSAKKADDKLNWGAMIRDSMKNKGK
ncbi:MAG: CBS domain-containing protein [Schwartzia sp.]|nr:CBS domain-containing protein [Schwartzia sp. (in: firmicutes)]